MVNASTIPAKIKIEDTDGVTEVSIKDFRDWGIMDGVLTVTSSDGEELYFPLDSVKKWSVKKDTNKKFAHFYPKEIDKNEKAVK